MSDGMTCTDLKLSPREPSLDELATVDELLAVPEPIGHLYGALVYLHHDTRELSIGSARVAVDHPYIVGTKIHDAALRRLGDIR